MPPADVGTLEVHDVFVRGERTRVRVEVSEGSKLVVVPFSGGKGVTRLTESGKLRSGLTDHPPDLSYGFLRTAAYAMDIGAVIAHFLRALWPASLVGGNEPWHHIGGERCLVAGRVSRGRECPHNFDAGAGRE